MEHLRIHFLLCITFLLVIFTCSEAETISSTESQKIQNLRAFAKLYGYVKYFHPSDEASAIDWDKFAIYGAKQVKDAKNTKELKTTLEALFLLIAPTIQIYTSGQKPEGPMKHVPDDTAGLKVVTWQHYGGGSGRPRSPFKSIRLNRENRIPISGRVDQTIDATKYRGKEIKLKAFARTNVSGFGNQSGLFLWIRGGRGGGSVDKRPIKSREWQAYEIAGKIDDDATRIFFGCHLKGIGRLWADEFQLFTKDESNEWQAIKIKDPGFEEDQANSKPQAWNIHDSPGYSLKIDIENPYKGDKCLLIGSQSLSGKLFEKHPKIGEVVNKALNAGLFCQIPLALYSDENGTLGKDEKYPLAKLLEKLEAVPAGKLTANDEDVRLANVVIAWNVFQHFYPYFDVVDVDWDSELTNTLQKAMTDKNEEDFYYTLSRFIAKLEDGHGWLDHPRVQSQWAYLPFRVDWIENQVIVTVSKDTTKVHKGDIIVSIDGTKAEQALLDAEKYISGSPQWRRVTALERFGYGDKGTKAKLVVKRDNQTFEIEVERNHRRAISEPKRPKIDKIKDDMYYVDLRRAEMKEIGERIHELAEATGVIFDLRGYPYDERIYEVICHLLQERGTYDQWRAVPQVTYPDYQKVTYRKRDWTLEPEEPRIEGKVVFLTDASAISYAEVLLAFIANGKLAEIVGQPTAGTSGNANRFRLPGSFRVSWTGMKVVESDGSQHYLIGILPTVSVKRTIQGVIEGRDEFLEKALEIINEK